MNKHAELIRLAEVASPGPWLQENADLYFKDDGYTRHMMTTDAGHDVCDEDGNDDRHLDNLKFISAANPVAVLALITENTDLLEALDALIAESSKLWEFCIDNRLDANDPDESAEPDPIVKARAAIARARGES